MNKRSFTQKEVVKITGVIAGTLQVWLRDGLIVPFKNATGRGSTRLYAGSDLTLIKLVSTLSKYSYNRRIVTNLCDTINNNPKAFSGISLKRLAQAKNAPPILKEIVNIKEDLLDPLIKRKGEPIVIKLSNGSWELGTMIGGLSIPGVHTTTLIINLTKIMNELRDEIKRLDNEK